ncbi:pyridoxamine 5'-phosphate oxidase family protein [bacterium]|nr:pyridoxamine 5'-phosphate oxidase family protein [bacterium]
MNHHQSQQTDAPEQRALRLIRSKTEGALSTIMSDDGFPYGSVIPFALSPFGSPLFFTASLAIHHKNMLKTPRASLLIAQGEGGDVQMEGRISLMGSVKPVSDDATLERYFRYFPVHRSYLKVHPFQLWSLDIERARFIAGFGDIHWIEGRTLQVCPLPGWSKKERSAVAHLNTDHTETIAALVTSIGMNGEESTVLGIDPFGVDIRSVDGDCRIPFPSVAKSTSDMRQLFISLSETT